MGSDSPVVHELLLTFRSGVLLCYQIPFGSVWIRCVAYFYDFCLVLGKG